MYVQYEFLYLIMARLKLPARVVYMSAVIIKCFVFISRGMGNAHVLYCECCALCSPLGSAVLCQLTPIPLPSNFTRLLDF
jgi:hypothetical protein